jgi:hypothetical protein
MVLRKMSMTKINTYVMHPWKFVLKKLSDFALVNRLSVQMPRIGAGPVEVIGML